MEQSTNETRLAGGLDNLGGQGGGLLADRGHSRNDCKLVERYGKNLSEDKRNAVMVKVVKALLEAKTPRDIAALARVYSSFDRINLDYLRFEVEKQQRETSDADMKDKAGKLLEQLAAMKATVSSGNSGD